MDHTYMTKWVAGAVCVGLARKVYFSSCQMILFSFKIKENLDSITKSPKVWRYNLSFIFLFFVIWLSWELIKISMLPIDVVCRVFLVKIETLEVKWKRRISKSHHPLTKTIAISRMTFLIGQRFDYCALRCNISLLLLLGWGFPPISVIVRLFMWVTIV